MKKMADEFSGDWQMYRLLTHSPQLCTLKELKTDYSLKEYYDFLEMIEVKESIRIEGEKQNNQ